MAKTGASVMNDWLNVEFRLCFSEIEYFIQRYLFSILMGQKRKNKRNQVNNLHPKLFFAMYS